MDRHPKISYPNTQFKGNRKFLIARKLGLMDSNLSQALLKSKRLKRQRVHAGTELMVGSRRMTRPNNASITSTGKPSTAVEHI